MIVLVTGADLLPEEPCIREALSGTGATVRFAEDARGIHLIAAREPVRCVLAGQPGPLLDAARSLRSDSTGASIPLIALVRELSVRAVTSAFVLGADDVNSTSDLSALRRRIAAITSTRSQQPLRATQGTCLLMHEAGGRQQLIAGALRQAGFEPLVAATVHEARAHVAKAQPRIVVVSERLPPDGGGAALERLRSGMAELAPVVVLGRSRKAGEAGVVGHSALSEYAPPNDLLFAIHELLQPRPLVDGRRSRRFLSATVCSFATEGRLLEQVVACTYNVSREGLYVRTLDAPDSQANAWLTVRLPGALRAVRLGGVVVWRRAQITNDGATAPPGFAVRFEPSLCPAADLAHYEEQYDNLLRLASS